MEMPPLILLFFFILFLACLGFYSWSHQAVAMRFLQIPGSAAPLCLLASLVNAPATDTSARAARCTSIRQSVDMMAKEPPHLTH